MPLSHQTAWLAVTLLCLLAPTLRAENYADWLNANFVGDAASPNPLIDPDGDGLSNLAEYAFGLNPKSPSADTPPLSAPTAPAATGEITFELLERAGPRGGVQIDLELSTDLTTWIRPPWRRTTLTARAGDPAGSVRTQFYTRPPARDTWFARARVTVVDLALETAAYYVAPTGDDAAAGTKAAPFATMKKAAELAQPGQLVYIRGGTYLATTKIGLTRTGTAATPIRIRAYPGEHPVLDVSATDVTTGQDAISISGSFYKIYGLEIVGAAHNSVKISGNDNTIENCISRAARNTGFHITGGTATTTYPARNLYLNCDSIRSFDAPIGGNADGFSAKWNLGLGNVFRGCRAIENSDDGWDLWMGDGSVLIENCRAIRNGINVWASPTFNGNGQGFKLGGNNVGAPHRLVRSLSWGNRSYGIDQNNNPTGLTVDQNVCWDNPGGALNLNHVGVTLVGKHTVRNNVAIAGTGSATVSVGGTAPVLQNNAWQLFTGTSVAKLTDFIDSNGTAAMNAARREDGGLPEDFFMRPVFGSRLIDRGVAITGDTWLGSAPDLGAYEAPAWSAATTTFAR
jgi:hypothetical protein